jgi:hypothetical protein
MNSPLQKASLGVFLFSIAVEMDQITRRVEALAGISSGGQDGQWSSKRLFRPFWGTFNELGCLRVSHLTSNVLCNSA